MQLYIYHRARDPKVFHGTLLQRFRFCVCKSATEHVSIEHGIEVGLYLKNVNLYAVEKNRLIVMH